MTIDERKTVNNGIGVIQNLILENREKLSISGVKDVLSFDDQVVMVETELGLLTVKGENIRINKLSLDTSEVIVEGEISYLAYSDKEQDKVKGGRYMITIKIEYFSEMDRQQLIDFLQTRYEIVEMGKIKNSPKQGSRKKYLYIEMIERD